MSAMGGKRVLTATTPGGTRGPIPSEGASVSPIQSCELTPAYQVRLRARTVKVPDEDILSRLTEGYASDVNDLQIIWRKMAPLRLSPI